MDPKTQGQALLAKMRKLQIGTDPGQTLQNKANPDGSVQFPARYYEGDEDDDLQEIKNQLASEKRPAPITDSDAARVQRKQAATEVVKQEEWFSNTWHFDASNPTKQRWAQSVFPEFFDRREQVIEEQARLQLALAKMKLRGPRSREDLDLMYAMDQGYITPSNKPLWDLTGAVADSQAARGLFNPRRNKMVAKTGAYGQTVNPLGSFPKGRGTEIPETGAQGGFKGYAFGFA